MSNTEKKTNHSILIGLLSESPILVEKALFTLRKSIDNDILEDADLMIVYARETETEPGTHEKKERGPNKLAEIARRFPGPAGDLLSFMKSRSARDLYVGFCGTVLLGILLYKWIFRLVTGTF